MPTNTFITSYGVAASSPASSATRMRDAAAILAGTRPTVVTVDAAPLRARQWGPHHPAAARTAIGPRQVCYVLILSVGQRRGVIQPRRPPGRVGEVPSVSWRLYAHGRRGTSTVCPANRSRWRWPTASAITGPGRARRASDSGRRSWPPRCRPRATCATFVTRRFQVASALADPSTCCRRRGFRSRPSDRPRSGVVVADRQRAGVRTSAA